jgi:hypothetical protein
VRPDPGGASDDSKLTGFGCFGQSDKASDWIADRLAEGPTGIAAWRVDCSSLVRPALVLCNNSLTFIKADISMRRHRVKYMRYASY